MHQDRDMQKGNVYKQIICRKKKKIYIYIYIILKVSGDCKLITSQKSDSTNITTKAIVEVQQHNEKLCLLIF